MGRVMSLFFFLHHACGRLSGIQYVLRLLVYNTPNFDNPHWLCERCWFFVIGGLDPVVRSRAVRIGSHQPDLMSLPQLQLALIIQALHMVARLGNRLCIGSWAFASLLETDKVT